jgi:acetyl esterase/lipase
MKPSPATCAIANVLRLLGGAAAAALILIPATAHTQAPVPKITPDVVYGHKDGLAMTFDVYTPANPSRAGVLFMVSGGWVSTWVPPESAIGRFAALLAKGFTVFSVRHGSSPRYKVPDAAADVERAVRFIKQNASTFGVDPERLGAWGGSAGGHLSLMLGLDPDAGNAQHSDTVLRGASGVAAVVAYFPPVDLREWAGPSERFPALDFAKDLAASVSPIQFVSQDDPPVLLIHGDADKLVPIAHSQRLSAALKGAGVTVDFVTIPGGDHGFTNLAHRQRATELMVGWFERHLLAKK